MPPFACEGTKRRCQNAREKERNETTSAPVVEREGETMKDIGAPSMLIILPQFAVLPRTAEWATTYPRYASEKGGGRYSLLPRFSGAETCVIITDLSAVGCYPLINPGALEGKDWRRQIDEETRFWLVPVNHTTVAYWVGFS